MELVSEWLFDVGALRHFGLDLLLPVGSSVAGAFVERIVDALSQMARTGAALPGTRSIISSGAIPAPAPVLG